VNATARKTGLARKKPNHKMADAGEKIIRLNYRMGEAEVFARNLKLLTQMRNLTPTTASHALCEYLVADAELRLKNPVDDEERGRAKTQLAKARDGIHPQWYRRLMIKGATRSHGTTREQFHGLSRWLGLQNADLWRDDLITFVLTDELPNVQEAKQEDRLTELPKSTLMSKFATQLQRLAGLLELDEYSFLVPLIDRLYLLELVPLRRWNRLPSAAETTPSRCPK